MTRKIVYEYNVYSIWFRSEVIQAKIKSPIFKEVIKIHFQVYYTEILFCMLDIISSAEILLFES